MSLKVKKLKRLQGLLVLSSRAPSIHHIIMDKLDALGWKPDVMYVPPYRETHHCGMCLARYWAERHNIPVLTRPTQLLRNIKRAVIFDAKAFSKTSGRLRTAGIEVTEYDQLYPFKHSTWSLAMPQTSPTPQQYLAEATGLPVTVVNEATSAERFARRDAKQLRDRLRALVKRFEKAGWEPVAAREYVAVNIPSGSTGRDYAVPRPYGAQCGELDFTPEALKPLARGPVKKTKQKKFSSVQSFFDTLPSGPNLPDRITKACDAAYERGYYEGLRVVAKLIANELTNNGQEP